MPLNPALGAIIAGGASRRFGSDKADARWQGRSLLAHAAAALQPEVTELVVCGRAATGFASIADRPPGIGPLGGLAAALRYARQLGLGSVLCIPVDVHPLPERLRERLTGDRPAVFARQHAIGWWPASLAESLDAYIAEGGRALGNWIEQSGARRIHEPPGLININRPSDLQRLPL